MYESGKRVLTGDGRRRRFGIAGMVGTKGIVPRAILRKAAILCDANYSTPFAFVKLSFHVFRKYAFAEF